MSETLERLVQLEKDFADHIAWHAAKNSVIGDARLLLRTMNSMVEVTRKNSADMLGKLREFMDLVQPKDIPPQREFVEEVEGVQE